MNFALAFTTFNRPAYLKQVLDTWKQAIYQSDRSVPVLFSCEPGPPVVQDLVQQFQDEFSRVRIVNNPTIAGVLANPWLAIDRAFDYWEVDFVILAEDDSIVYRDILEYFDFAAEKLKEETLAICSFSSTIAHDSQAYEITCKDWFSSIVWGIWRAKWAILKESWDFDYTFDGWDWHIRREVLRDNNLKCAFPTMSRSQHIGRDGGVHCRPSEFDALKAPSFAGDIKPTHGSFYIK